MEDLDLALSAARAGSEVLLKYWQQLGKEDADLKARNDWVSKADRESEKAIMSVISSRSPGDSFLCEESGSTAGSAERLWVIDPLDGTSNYLQHFPFWCISIALRQGTETVTALIYEPLRETVFTAERGSGAFLNGKRVRVSDQPSVTGAFLATGFPFRAQKHVGVYCSIFQDVISVAKGVRRAGSAALDLAYTAAGVFDGFFELHLAPWDIAAGALLVQEAGGIVTNFSGGEQYWDQGNIVGAPPAVHKDLLELIARHAKEDQLCR